MSELYGFTLVYGIPAALSVPFWWLVRRLTHMWNGRDVMLSLIPEAAHVHHTERLLGTRTKPKESTFRALLSEYDKRGRNH